MLSAGGDVQEKQQQTPPNTLQDLIPSLTLHVPLKLPTVVRDIGHFLGLKKMETEATVKKLA